MTKRAYPDPTLTMCRVCRRVLDYESGSQTFVHTDQDKRAEDHQPVPVRAVDSPVPPRVRCDFCNADISEAADLWVVPVASFGYLPQVGVSTGDWCACPACAAFINEHRWNGLVGRVLSAQRAADSNSRSKQLPVDVHRMMLARLYAQLARNMVDDPYQPGAQR